MSISSFTTYDEDVEVTTASSATRGIASIVALAFAGGLGAGLLVSLVIVLAPVL